MAALPPLSANFQQRKRTNFLTLRFLLKIRLTKTEFTIFQVFGDSGRATGPFAMPSKGQESPGSGRRLFVGVGHGDHLRALELIIRFIR